MASFKQTDLLAEPVEPDELKELLSRLAATEAIFAEPQTTIRDVAEATDASPLLIGRILREMRGPDRIDLLEQRLDRFERLVTRVVQSGDLENAGETLSELDGVASSEPTWQQLQDLNIEHFDDSGFVFRDYLTLLFRRFLIIVIIAVMIIVLFFYLRMKYLGY